MTLSSHESDMPPKQAKLLFLEELAGVDRPLTREEIKAVFEQIPLMVVADDDPCVRRMAVGLAKRMRQDRDSVVDFEGDMTQCFDEARKLLETKLPIILCKNGHQASEATRIICERDIPSGILALDQNMGGPTGMDIFRDYAGKIPVDFTKILQSGSPPADIREYLEKGLVDASVDKIQLDTVSAVARAYVKKMFSQS